MNSLRFYSLTYSITALILIAIAPALFNEIYIKYFNSIVLNEQIDTYRLFYTSSTLSLEIGTLYSLFRYIILRDKAINNARIDELQKTSAHKILIAQAKELVEHDQAFEAYIKRFDRDTYIIFLFCLFGFAAKEGFEIINIFLGQFQS